MLLKGSSFCLSDAGEPLLNLPAPTPTQMICKAC